MSPLLLLLHNNVVHRGIAIINSTTRTTDIKVFRCCCSGWRFFDVFASDCFFSISSQSQFSGSILARVEPPPPRSFSFSLFNRQSEMVPCSHDSDYYLLANIQQRGPLFFSGRRPSAVVRLQDTPGGNSDYTETRTTRLADGRLSYSRTKTAAQRSSAEAHRRLGGCNVDPNRTLNVLSSLFYCPFSQFDRCISPP